MSKSTKLDSVEIYQLTNVLIDKIRAYTEKASFDPELRKLLQEIEIHQKELVKMAARQQISEEKLKESESKYRSLVENIHEALVIEDIEGNLVYANSEFCNMHGFSEHELSSLNIKDYTAPESYDEIKERHELRMSGHTVPDDFIYQGMHKDGRKLWIETRVSLLIKDGKIIGTQSLERDISERKIAEQALKEKERHLRLITNHLPVMIAHVDSEKRFKFVNEPFAERFELQVSDIIGKHTREILSEDAFMVAEPFMDIALNGKSTSYEMELKDNQTSKQVLSVKYVPEQDQEGHIIGFIAAITEVTEMKSADEKIRAQLEELKRWQLVTLGREDRNRELKEEVNELLERLGEPQRYSSQKGNS